MIKSLFKKQLLESNALKTFFCWWLGELSSLVPRKFQTLLTSTKNHLILVMQDNTCRLIRPENGHQHLLATFNIEQADDENLHQVKKQFLDGLRGLHHVTVLIPDDKLLSRDAFFPLITEGSLSSVLKFEIDRLTPFQADQVWFGYQLVGRLPKEDKLKVRLTVARRDYLQAIKEKIAMLGLEVSAILPNASLDLESDAFNSSAVKELEISRLNLMPEELRPKEEPLWSKSHRNMAAIILLLLTAVLIVPAYRLDQAIATIKNDISAIEENALRVSEKKFQLAQQSELGSLLVARKKSEKSKLNVIRDLTKLIDPGTWITRLDINGLEVNMLGESNNSSTLIQLLEKFPKFQNVRFDSPVTRNTATDKERFEIRFELSEEALNNE